MRRGRASRPAVATGFVLGPEFRSRLVAIGSSIAPATIDCAGQRHQLSVDSAGDLTAHDHDADGELVLHTLGGGLPDCLAYVRVWRQSFNDAYLLFWAEHERLGEPARRHLRRQWIDNYWDGWPTEPVPAAVLFAQAWQDALGVAVARRSAAAGTQHAAVARAVQVRLRTAFVRSLAGVTAHRKPDALVPLTVAVAAGAPAVDGRLAPSASWAHVRVDPSWLWDIWGGGLAVVDGRLVVGGDDTALSVLEWQAGGGAHHHPVILRQ